MTCQNISLDLLLKKIRVTIFNLKVIPYIFCLVDVGVEEKKEKIPEIQQAYNERSWDFGNQLCLPSDNPAYSLDQSPYDTKPSVQHFFKVNLNPQSSPTRGPIDLPDEKQCLLTNTNPPEILADNLEKEPVKEICQDRKNTFSFNKSPESKSNEDTDLKQNKQERNRVSARESRKRKKEYYLKIESQVK